MKGVGAWLGKALKIAWVLFCCIIVGLCIAVWITSLAGLMARDDFLQIFCEALKTKINDYGEGKIFDLVFDTVFSDSTSLLVASTVVGTIYFYAVWKTFRREVLGIPESIEAYPAELDRAIKYAAVVPLSEVESAARRIVSAHAPLWRRLSALYGHVYHDFVALQDLVKPEARPEVMQKTEVIEGHSNIILDGVDPAGLINLQKVTMVSETRADYLSRIRARVDLIGLKRADTIAAIKRDLKEMLNDIRLAEIEAKAQKPKPSVRERCDEIIFWLQLILFAVLMLSAIQIAYIAFMAIS